MALISSSFAPEVGGVEEAVRQLAAGLRARRARRRGLDRGARWRLCGARPSTGSRCDTCPPPFRRSRVGAITRFVGAAPSAWREWARARARLPARPGARALFRSERAVRACGAPSVRRSRCSSRRMARRSPMTAACSPARLCCVGTRGGHGACDAVTAPSSVVLDDLEAHYGLERGTVIPNGVDLTYPARPTRGAAAVLVRGRAAGTHEGLRPAACARSRRRSSTHRSVLVIGGDGPERERLESLIASLGLDARVELRGWMPPRRSRTRWPGHWPWSYRVGWRHSGSSPSRRGAALRR